MDLKVQETPMNGSNVLKTPIDEEVIVEEPVGEVSPSPSNSV